MATTSVSDDLVKVRHALAAAQALLDVVPAAVEAAQRLEDFGFAGAELARAQLEAALERCDGSPAVLADDLRMLFEANGDLGHWCRPFYVDHLDLSPNEALWEIRDSPNETAALRGHLDRAS